MIEEYDHRHQLYVFYFSIFMPSFHLFPVGLFPTFKFGYHQPSIGEKRKQFLPVKKRNERVSFFFSTRIDLSTKIYMTCQP